jgi:hypothetical protein
MTGRATITVRLRAAEPVTVRWPAPQPVTVRLPARQHIDARPPERPPQIIRLPGTAAGFTRARR